MLKSGHTWVNLLFITTKDPKRFCACLSRLCLCSTFIKANSHIGHILDFVLPPCVSPPPLRFISPQGSVSWGAEQVQHKSLLKQLVVPPHYTVYILYSPVCQCAANYVEREHRFNVLDHDRRLFLFKTGCVCSHSHLCQGSAAYCRFVDKDSTYGAD